ncbi:hypothetical protein [Nocardia asiatica]|nr:hypothetical protein [Nocardia asiatica]
MAVSTGDGVLGSHQDAEGADIAVAPQHLAISTALGGYSQVTTT